MHQPFAPLPDPAAPEHTGPSWLPSHLRGERDQLFIAYLGLLAVANAAFVGVSWLVDFEPGYWIHLAALVLALTLARLRWTGWRLRPLLRTLQLSALVQGGLLAWLTGGIYSPLLSWLALAALPAVLDRHRLSSLMWIGASTLLILGMYLYALLGGTVTLGVMPLDLVHWHLLVALTILGLQLLLLFKFDALRAQRLRRVQLRNRALQHMREVLLATQKHKDLFVASISHDLRTPMNAILGLADLIHHDARLPPELRVKVTHIQKSSEHLLTIINDLLDHSQIEAGQLQIAHEPYHLHETLYTAFNILLPRAQSKHIRYETDLGPDLPKWVMGDGHRLTQVLVNLLGNAVKFTHEGEVVLQARYEESLEHSDHGRLHLCVRDTGIGIAPEHQQQVFESFTQADQSIARRFGGNGLGLSITRHLVEAMGGSIQLESQLGLGSSFQVDLPCEATKAPFTPAPMEDPGIATTAPRVLIADDNAINRQVAMLQLRRHIPGAEIEQAEDGLQAFEKIRDQHYDVVLMDLLMPGMDGLQATRKVREELPEPQRSVPIIALTANNDRREHERCIAAGMNEAMVKPFDRAQLVQRVLFYAC